MNGEYFKTLRRKIGTLTLGLACLSMTGWIRTMTRTNDLIAVPSSVFWSKNGRLEWQGRIVTDDPRDDTEYEFEYQSFENRMDYSEWMISKRRIQWQCGCLVAGEDTVSLFSGNGRRKFLSIPYWLVVTMLTLLSAWLLLSNSRANRQSTAFPPKTDA